MNTKNISELAAKLPEGLRGFNLERVVGLMERQFPHSKGREWCKTHFASFLSSYLDRRYGVRSKYSAELQVSTSTELTNVLRRLVSAG